MLSSVHNRILSSLCCWAAFSPSAGVEWLAYRCSFLRQVSRGSRLEVGSWLSLIGYTFFFFVLYFEAMRSCGIWQGFFLWCCLKCCWCLWWLTCSLSLFFFLYLSIYLFIYLSVYLSISMFLSIYLTVYLYLSVYLFLFLCLFLLFFFSLSLLRSFALFVDYAQITSGFSPARCRGCPLTSSKQVIQHTIPLHALPRRTMISSTSYQGTF